MSGVNSYKVRAKSNNAIEGEGKEALTGDCNAPLSIHFWSLIVECRWFRRHVQCSRWEAFWNPSPRHPCPRLRHIIHWLGRAQHKVPCSQHFVASIYYDPCRELVMADEAGMENNGETPSKKVSRRVGQTFINATCSEEKGKTGGNIHQFQLLFHTAADATNFLLLFQPPPPAAWLFCSVFLRINCTLPQAS